MELKVLVTMFFKYGFEKEFYLFSGGDDVEEAEEYIAKSAKQIAECFHADDYILYVPKDARVISKWPRSCPIGLTGRKGSYAKRKNHKHHGNGGRNETG